GRIELDERSLPLGSPRRALRAGIGYISSDRKSEGLFLSRTIAENLVATRFRDIAIAGLLSPAKLRATARLIAKRAGVDTDRVGEVVSQLSGGNQQKTFIGRWLERRDLRVLLLDEPTRGVDVGGREDIHAVIRQVAAEGAAILFASSDLEEVLDLADDIVVMRG